MPEHVHEWEYDYHDDYIWCKGGDGCSETMTASEMIVRLNEYEKLKRATEALRAGIDELKDACKDDPNEMGGPFVSLSWVERTLEGK